MTFRLSRYVDREMDDRSADKQISLSADEICGWHYLSIEEENESLQILMKFLLTALQTAILLYEQAVTAVRGQLEYFVGSPLESWTTLASLGLKVNLLH